MLSLFGKCVCDIRFVWELVQAVLLRALWADLAYASLCRTLCVRARLMREPVQAFLCRTLCLGFFARDLMPNVGEASGPPGKFYYLIDPLVHSGGERRGH